MAAALAKLSVGRPGLGAAHASYIPRMSALDPDHKNGQYRDSEERPEPLVMVDGDPSPEPERVLASKIAQDMAERSLPGLGGQNREVDETADRVWAGNVPSSFTATNSGGQPSALTNPPTT